MGDHSADLHSKTSRLFFLHFSVYFLKCLCIRRKLRLQLRLYLVWSSIQNFKKTKNPPFFTTLRLVSNKVSQIMQSKTKIARFYKSFLLWYIFTKRLKIPLSHRPFSPSIFYLSLCLFVRLSAICLSACLSFRQSFHLSV